MRIALFLIAALSLSTFALGLRLATQEQQEPAVQDAPPPTFEVFKEAELLKRRADSKRAYLPFLRRPSLHCGIYHIAKGARDGQSPHGEDEVYYVLAGAGRFTCGKRTVDIAVGDTLFVAAHEEHRFHDVTADLDLLVFFSTAKPVAEGAAGKDK